MSDPSDKASDTSRRGFLGRSTASAMSLAAMAQCDGQGNDRQGSGKLQHGQGESLSLLAAKAKRVIYLCQAGGPSQLDLFVPKPKLCRFHGQKLPADHQGNSDAGRKRLAGSEFRFKQHGQSGTWLSELLPYHRQIVDDVCFIHSMQTDALNHDQAITMLQTGSPFAGQVSLGAWVASKLGIGNPELPAFMVLNSSGEEASSLPSTSSMPFSSRWWGSGFSSGSSSVGAEFEGVPYRSEHSANGKTTESSRLESVGDLSDEPASTFKLYGEAARIPGTFAANCLLARRLAERNVRFVQLYHQGWDHHFDLRNRIGRQALETDQASAALIGDLKQRGMLDETLVIWCGEFGRTPWAQGAIRPGVYGRDHHGACFTSWVAGGGVNPGVSIGQTDDFGGSVIEDPVGVRDFNATILRLLGIDDGLPGGEVPGEMFPDKRWGEVVKKMIG